MPRPPSSSPSTVCAACGGDLVDIGLGPQCLSCLMNVAMDEAAGLPAAGHRFGHYELHGELGRGGMGVVCRAWEPNLRRWVALKILLGGVFAQPAFLKRFQREAMAAARLRHPGIAVIHDAGETEGQAFYTMELIEGGSLSDWIARGNPDLREAARLLEVTARSVAFAHQQAVVHRDLKPSNIMLTSEGQPKVVDFGLALIIEDVASGELHLTVSQSALGTPAYMAPGVAAGGVAGISADIYSLGAVLYNMISGQPPHQGANVQSVLAKARAGEITDPRRVNPDIPPDLATICLKCLDPEPASRYLTAGALADELRRFLEGKPVEARPIGLAGNLWRWARRNRALAGLTAAFFLSLAGGSIQVIRQAAQNRRQEEVLRGQREEIRQADGRLLKQVYVSDVRAAFQEWSAGNPEGARNWLRGQEGNPDKGVEWGWLWRHSAGEQARELHRGTTPRRSPGDRFSFSAAKAGAL